MAQQSILAQQIASSSAQVPPSPNLGLPPTPLPPQRLGVPAPGAATRGRAPASCHCPPDPDARPPAVLLPASLLGKRGARASRRRRAQVCTDGSSSFPAGQARRAHLPPAAGLRGWQPWQTSTPAPTASRTPARPPRSSGASAAGCLTRLHNCTPLNGQYSVPVFHETMIL